MSVFAQHIDTPEQRHRCVLTDARHLRCLDCQRTLVLPSGPSTTGSTSTSRELPRLDQACPRHPGEWPDTCGRCRADELEAREARPLPEPTADVAARVAECRAVLKPAAPKPSRHDVDEHAMAQARAEVAALAASSVQEQPAPEKSGS